MNMILKQIHQLRDRDLRRLSAAVDSEIQRRLASAQAAMQVDEDLPYEGPPAVLPMRVAGFGPPGGPRRAA
jgi:hypothetical protein